MRRPSPPRSSPNPTPRRLYHPPSTAYVLELAAGDLIAGVRPLDVEALQLNLAREALDAPVWCVGDRSLAERKCVAIVGTRNVSGEGASRARRLAKELSRAGVVVVSGLAKGVDTAALTSAIDSGGRVIGVIGTPVDKAYPAENKQLQETIYREHLLVSQFSPGERVFPSNFPLRNRLMALITDASVIVEAGETSGTLHQATECVRLGRWLFIAQSVVSDPNLTWPTKFLNFPKVRVLSDTFDIIAAIG